MTARRPRRPRRAFSLLEVLVASVILGGALVVILGSISSSLSAGTRAERLDAAHAIAGNRLRLAAAGAAGTLPAEGDEELSGVTYRWRVERTPSDAGELLRCVVSWRHRGRRRRVVADRFAPPPPEVAP